MQKHYAQGAASLGARVRAAVKPAAAAPVRADALAGVDEFHAGGPKATALLFDAMRLSELGAHDGAAPRLLDVGSGLGGPARRAAV